eukprot:GHUV01005994.1.p3 GENE.GHUV01005994.1~~GHUV01005994.1.p3  ORF type:complete len:155 (+),score=44.56 GHUV01005994.1:168-632(+)
MLSGRVLRLGRPHRAGGWHGKALPNTHISPVKSTSTGTRTVAADQLQYWDVVEYRAAATGNQPARRLGLVQQVTADGVQVSPLIEEDEGVWVPDEEYEEQQIGVGSVLQIVDHVYGQRQDKEHNPHGEHAHDVWQVMVPIPDEVYRGSLKVLHK